MNKEIKVLDQGYVRLVESYGKGDAEIPEAGIIEAARQSTQGNFRGWSEDEKLLSYLFNNDPKHSTPFEFCGMVIEVKAPIFVFREWHRHRTQSYNEMSARYAPLPDENYIPTKERLFLTQQKNKQAQAVSGSQELTGKDADAWLTAIQGFYDKSEGLYQKALERGIPKEVARIVLPVGRYSKMRASANLLNWLKFLKLRMDANAQWEIRQYANAVAEIIAQEFPKTWSQFNK